MSEINWEKMEQRFLKEQEEYNLDEIHEEVLKKLSTEEEKRKSILKEKLVYFKDNIDYDFEHVEEYLGFDIDDKEYLNYHEHIGYVSVEKADYSHGFQPSACYYEITGDDNDKLFYCIQDESDEHTFHVLVYQTTGYCEDDYSGYLLFPMKDGKYWKIRFWS